MARTVAAEPLPLLRITDLEATMHQYGLSVVDVNNAGQVLSYRLGGHSGGPTFLWHPDAGVQMFRVRGATMVPTALNDAGLVTGQISRIGDTPTPYIWHPAKGLRLLSLSPGLSDGTPMAINIHGQIAGFANSDVLEVHAIVGSAKRGLFDPRPQQRGKSSAHAINAAGHVGGTTAAPMGCCTAAMLVREHGQVQMLGSLARPGENDHSKVRGLNDADQVVGASEVGRKPHAFFWSEATSLFDLGLSPGDEDWSEALDINALGQVVGDWGNATRSSTFYWDAEHGGVDLNDRLDPSDPLTPRTLIVSPFDFARINDHGQIVTTAIIDGHYRPVLLSPVAP
ncbi:MAG TPA: hypothetical protein VGQ91_15735 [Ideonella sp.]|nr:hypothetical protein [Ideonella sp.]